MKIPQSMMNDLIDTVMASLPYEEKFIVKSDESKVILKLFNALKEVLPEGLDGHMYFHLKKIDSNPEQQQSIHSNLVKLYPILENYFIEIPEIAGISHEL